jgi:hypothetical protein
LAASLQRQGNWKELGVLEDLTIVAGGGNNRRPAKGESNPAIKAGTTIRAGDIIEEFNLENFR